MDYINTRQPKPFKNVGPQLFVPRDDEDVVPNPFAIPPEWLEVWQAEADDKAAMEAAEAAAKDAEDLKAESDAAEVAASKDSKKADGIIASLSAAIPQFFHNDEKRVERKVTKIEKKVDEVAQQIATADTAEKKAAGILEDLQGAVSGALGGTAHDTGANAAKGVLEQVQGALGGILGQVQQTSQKAGQQAGAGAGQGLIDTLKAGIPGLINTAQQAAQPAVQQVVGGAVQAARPGVAELAHTAGKSATAGAQEQLKDKGTGLGIDTTTLMIGGVAVLGALGLGAWFLSGDKKFGALNESSAEDFQKMLDKATWTRPAGSPAVKWLEAPKSERYMELSKSREAKDGLMAMQDGSGLGAGVAIVGGASALAVLIGYILKGKFDKTASGILSDKTASGAYGTGLGGASPSGPISRRASWWRDHRSGAAGSPLVLRSSPLHPFTLADALGMSKELLHLDQATILGPNPPQKDHDDFFAAYPIGHKAGSDNCDAARLNKGGTVYMKDAKKSQAWDNGWLKGYYDGWVAEGCKATLTHTNPSPSPSTKTASGPDDLEWGAEMGAGAPDVTWNYIFTYQDGTSQTDPTPTPNSGVGNVDALVPETAKAAHAVKVDRVRLPDNYKVTVWTADKGANGGHLVIESASLEIDGELVPESDWAAESQASGPPAYGIVPGLWSALQPWQRDAAVRYKLNHPNFGNDFQEMIRVLAITPDQIKKANASYQPFASAQVLSDTRTAMTPTDPSLQGTSGLTPLVQDPDDAPFT